MFRGMIIMIMASKLTILLIVMCINNDDAGKDDGDGSEYNIFDGDGDGDG